MANLEELLVYCNVDIQHRGPGTDHVPIHTVFEVPVARHSTTESANFRATNWKKFKEELQ